MVKVKWFIICRNFR